MSMKVFAAVTGALLVNAATAFAQQAFPLNVRDPAPLGDGYIDKKPYDVLGITTGMDAAQAASIAEKHYAQQNRKMQSGINSFEYGSEKFLVAIGPVDGWGAGKAEDTLFLGMTTAANKSQVVYIKRFVTYPKDKPASFDQTLAAIKAKYGDTDMVQTLNSSVTLNYAVRNGALARNTDPERCISALADLNTHPNADRSFRFPFVKAAQSGVPEKCSVVMTVELEFAEVSNVGNIRNKSAIQGLTIVIADLDRTWAAVQWDAKERERLRELAKTSGPRGTGASKL